MTITKKINKKIIKHVRKVMQRQGFSKKTIQDTLLLDWRYDQMIYALALKGWTF